MSTPKRLINTTSSQQILVLLLCDLLGVLLAAWISWQLKAFENPKLSEVLYLHGLPFLLVISPVVYGMLELYPALGLGAAEELRRLTIGTTVVFLTCMGFTFATKDSESWSRQVLFGLWFICLFLLPLMRAVTRRLLCRRRWWGIPCVIMGAGATGERVARLLRERPWLGLRAVALVDDDAGRAGKHVADLPVVTPIVDQVLNFAKQGVRHGILAIPSLPPADRSRLLDSLGEHLRHIHIAPAMPGSPDVIASTREFADTLVLEVRQNLLRIEARFIKRLLDILIVIVGGLLSAPFILGVMLLIKLSSPGPVFFGQSRLGRGGREFTAWKFRSMVPDAQQQLQRYLEEHPELREEWERHHKLKDDPRVTWIGAILRRSSLDELPQLWNVFMGQMSLVGPRPIVQAEVDRYGERYQLYKKVRPGLSGLWQVSGRNDVSYTERVALDCYYVRNWSVWLDIVILARTVRVVVLGKGAY